MENQALECHIAVMLRLIGIKPNVRGWRYIITAVELAAADEELVHAVEKELYPAVAAKHETTPSRVERCIRSAIEYAWTNGSPDAQQHYFGAVVSPEKGKPTNATFIAGLADWARGAAI